MKQMQLGLNWNTDGHRMEVTKIFKNGKVQITETWVSEDTWEDCKHTANYGVGTDDNGNEYAYAIDYPEYKLYATGADNWTEEKEDTTMKTTFTTISGNTFTTNEQGNYFYMIDTTGKKCRIKKSEFEAAQRQDALEKLNREQIEKNEFVNISEEDIGSKIAEIEESETTEEIERIQRIMKETDRISEEEGAKEDAEDTQNTEAPAPASDAKKTPKKAKKNTRKKKVQVGGFEFQEGEIHLILTPKQVEFLKHLSDSPFWQNGVQSTLWINDLCDEITGQFEGKPMTVGAMVSTLREKGILAVAIGRLENKKAKYIELTDFGQHIITRIGIA